MGKFAFAFPNLIAVVRPFQAVPQLPHVDPTGWYKNTNTPYNEWVSYEQPQDGDWYLWRGDNLLLLTKTPPGVYPSGDYFSLATDENTESYQGTYTYQGTSGQDTIEVYAWTPFDIVLSRLVEMLGLQPDLAQLVPTMNLIDLVSGGIYRASKYRRSTADFPEIIIEPADGTYKAADSTSFLVQQNYRIILEGDEEIVSRHFMPTKWALIQALGPFLQNPNGGQLLDLFFVGITTVIDISGMRSATVPEWRAEFAIRVDMFVPRTLF
jgi:hypothetical protein